MGLTGELLVIIIFLIFFAAVAVDLLLLLLLDSGVRSLVAGVLSQHEFFVFDEEGASSSLRWPAGALAIDLDRGA